MSSLIVDVEAVAIDRAEDYIEPVEAPSNYKDEAKIAAYIKDATAKAVDRCALDPDLARIVVLGCGDVDGDDTALICKNEQQEAAALRAFWGRAVNAAGVVRTLISFNGFGYDLPLLVRRSQYLGVDHPVLNIDKYRSPHIDLMQVLTFRGAIKPHRLSFYCSRFGMAINDPYTGADIARLVRDGDWKAVEEHNLSDLGQTRFLAQKLKLIQGMRVAA